MKVVIYTVGIAFLLWISGSLYRRRKRGKRVICVVENNCTGCRRCVGRCSRRVLETAENGTGCVVVKYPDRCTACGHCTDTCRFNALKLIRRT
ncbi:MAG: 4Fe-4S binding protein [Tannerella sp.]|jgi:NAD-dependent dihydropyrimidine dehydrogenase PreA subunit|nr:4Fe-4S binding protein [Tannerella sp.]